MAMWTAKPKRGTSPLSDWERAERDERMRHALWLVGHGASMTVVAAECGIRYETLRTRVRREANLQKSSNQKEARI